MVKYVYGKRTDKLLRTEEAQPVCGDYCDSCGDCLYHDGDGQCYGNDAGLHFWVVYEDEPEPEGVTRTAD